ncbi:MAG TPA: dihydropteroate synthase [Motiliproteus sp.]
MGILNVTPDSFSDGGQLYRSGGVCRDALLKRAEAMVAAGASILDVGGESTRPGAARVGLQEELDRVLPALEVLSRELNVALSVDTSAPEVMMAAAEVGCDLINDIRALQRPGAMEAAASTGLPVCLMHMQGQPGSMQQAPQYSDVVDEVAAFLRERMAACAAAGIATERLLLDPGFGFGKNLQHNLRLLNQLERLHALGAPLLIGTSRKSMIGGVLGRTVDERLAGGLATVVLALMKGGWIFRVHDVVETVDVLRMCRAVISEGEELDG